MTEQTLPVALECERMVLGAVLLNGGLMDALRTTLTVADFGVEKHREIWKDMCGLYDECGEVEMVGLRQRMVLYNRSEPLLASYAAELIDGLPEPPSLDRYIAVLKDKETLRRLVVVGENLAMSASGEMEAGEALRERVLRDLTNSNAMPSEHRPVSTGELVERLGVDELLHPKMDQGIRLPWDGLNRPLRGLRQGQVVLVAADTGKGKTSFALQCGAHVARQGAAAVYWSLEMPPRALFRRLVNQMTGATGNRQAENEAACWLHDNPIYFDAHSRTVPGFLGSLRQVRHRARIGLAIVDYLQLIRAAGRIESRTREVGENSRSLKLAALDLDLPFLVLSQFARKKDGGEYGIHDLKESGDIENDSDVILLLNGSAGDGVRPVPVAVRIGKQREGPAGFDVPLVFHPKSQSFHSEEGQ